MLAFNFSVQRGDFLLQAQAEMPAQVTGLCGASGAGKSTLLAVIAGLQKPSSGFVVLNNSVLVSADKKINLAPEKRRIGMVFQDAQLFPHLSVRQNLLYGFNNIAEESRAFSAEKITDLLEINHLLTRRPAHLSGGEKQRVSLGRALLYSPHLLLLDEPLAALDEARKKNILPFLKRVRDELALPMIYVSHARAEVDYLADEVWLCEAGKLRKENNA